MVSSSDGASDDVGNNVANLDSPAPSPSPPPGLGNEPEAETPDDIHDADIHDPGQDDEDEHHDEQPHLPEQPPWDVLYPRRSRFRDILIQHALPNVWTLLRNPENRLKPPRELVDQALEKCKADGNKFWGSGTFDVYTRKRSAADAIVVHYFGTLQDYVAGRPVAPL